MFYVGHLQKYPSKRYFFQTKLNLNELDFDSNLVQPVAKAFKIILELGFA